jgi:hypothetical protein
MKRKLAFVAAFVASTFGPVPSAFATKIRFENIYVHALVQTSLGASHVQKGVNVTFVIETGLGSTTLNGVTDSNGQCHFDVPISGRVWGGGGHLRFAKITITASWNGWVSQTFQIKVPPHETNVSGDNPPPPQTYPFDFTADLVLTYHG